jgi:predicted dehydrogenase
LKLGSVATNSGAAAESARKGFGFKIAQAPSELLSNPDLDAVFILTRHDSHAAYAESALAQGKAVFVEKPLAVDREQLETVLAAYAKGVTENRSPFLMVGFNRRFAPFTERLLRFFAGRRDPMLVHVRGNAGFVPRGSWIQEPRNGGRIIGELCHFIDWARAVVRCPIQTVTAAALPDAGRYNRDNLTITISFEDGSLANLLDLANGDCVVAKEYFEVFCEGSIARIDDFKTLYLSRNGRTKTCKSGRDKGHRKEIERTIEAMEQGKDAPIPFAELIEVTEATFAVEEAIRTQRTVFLNARRAFPPARVEAR